MTQEEKSLLLQDLCARLPYGVMCQMKDEVRFIGEKSPYYDYILSERHIELLRRHKGFYIKPYLRPMNSMTKEEGKELEKLFYKIDSPCWVDTTYGCVTFAGDNDFIDAETAEVYINWLNKKMFDYRGLIEKGLALEAPKDMYNIK